MAQHHVFNSSGCLYQWIGLLLLSLLITSCSHVKRQDGPPNFYVDDSKIHNAIPKPEPLAKYGNMRSYVVFGKRYYVMPSSKHYSAIGTASWYGTQFHSHRTSSGERYNMLGMTAAHKTLPLPTYVQVTNLKNHRQVIVKVNDRGPFESNRIIDLSYVAAKKLGMLGHGTAKVRVDAIDPYAYWHAQQSAPVSLAANVKKSAHQTLYIQVGAFKNKTNALRLQQRLAANVNHPIIISKPGAASHLYRVKIGPFASRSEANNASQHLKRMGIQGSSQHF